MILFPKNYNTESYALVKKMKKNIINLFIAIFSLAFFISQHALSFELGKITVHSKLQEPLRAEIQLLIDKKESLADLTFNLGGDELYRNFGIEKNSAIDSLDLKLVKNQKGEDLLNLSGSKEVTDSFFDLLIIVNDGRKKVTREVNFYVNQESDGTKKIAKNSSHKNNINSLVIKNSEDTVYKIARENQIQGVSRAQMIAALFNLNSDAFEKNDINQLKIGSIITLPQEDYFKNLSSEAAVNELKNLSEKIPSKTTTLNAEKITRFNPLKNIIDKSIDKTPPSRINEKKNDALDKMIAFEEKINALEEKLNEANRINEEIRNNEENKKITELNQSNRYKNAPVHNLINSILSTFQYNGDNKILVIFSILVLFFLFLIVLFLFIRIVQFRKVNAWKKNVNHSYEESLRKTTKFSHHMPIKNKPNEAEKQKPKNWRFY